MLGRNTEPTGCSNTRLRIISRTSSAMLRWSSTVPSHFDFAMSGPFGNRSPAATLCHHACGSANRLAGLSLVTALHLKAAWLNVHTSSEAGARGTTPLKILFALPEVPNCRTFTLSL